MLRAAGTCFSSTPRISPVMQRHLPCAGRAHGPRYRFRVPESSLAALAFATFGVYEKATRVGRGSLASGCLLVNAEFA